MNAMPGVKLGLFVAAVILGLSRFAPQPTGTVLLWSLISLQLAAGSAIIWRRLRLPWLRIGMTAMFPAALAVVAAAAQEYDLSSLTEIYPRPVAVAIWIVMFLAPPLSLAAEWRGDSPEWRAWSTRTEHATLWEVITFRHIPDMQHRTKTLATSSPAA